MPSSVPRLHWWILGLALLGLVAHFVWLLVDPLSKGPWGGALHEAPLFVAIVVGGTPLLWELGVKISELEFGADLLAGISILVSVVLGEYLAGTVIVVMLSGGQALESFALERASSVLAALAKRMPTLAHRRRDGVIADVPVEQVEVGDLVVCFPHEICPVDGSVVEGRGSMDESFLSGEPYVISKTVGSNCLSGAVNGEGALVLRTERRAEDSRYAQIMRVMRDSEQRRPLMRRLGDQLGAWYTPFAVAAALLAWQLSGDPRRFLAVLVVATPCPLLIAIPVAIMGAISLAARRGIIIRDPAILERIETCTTAVFDKTGTLTYGRPKLTEIVVRDPWDEPRLLTLVAALERYSKHPLAAAVMERAKEAGVTLPEVHDLSERPGEGLGGQVGEHRVQLLSRRQWISLATAAGVAPEAASAELPSQEQGLECVAAVDGKLAGVLRFRDAPRADSRRFLDHLAAKHRFKRVMLVSGDRESEVRYLANLVGIQEVHGEQSPEQKLEIVRREQAAAPTLFVGDGVNDGPALAAAAVGIAFGKDSDVAGEAAGAVVVERSLGKVDELMHLGRRLRRIVLESVVGGMALSVIGMAFAAFGWLSPVQGAVLQEAIDVLAVLNAMRVGLTNEPLRDY